MIGPFKVSVRFFVLGLLIPLPLNAFEIPPPIENEATVNASLKEVWEAWTTSSGLPTWVGLGADVDARPRGVFRVVFQPDQTDPVARGNDGTIIAIEPMKMLAVTWMTPMHISELTGNSTSLVIYFDELNEGQQTRVRLINSGYGIGEKWEEAYAYNVKGWDRVLSSLEYRFETGPIDWDWALKEMKKGQGWPWWRENRNK